MICLSVHWNVCLRWASLSVGLHGREMVTRCQTSPLRQYQCQFCMIVGWSLCVTLLYWDSITISFAWSWADHCVWHSSTGSVSLPVLHDRELITVYDTSLLSKFHCQFCMIVGWSLCMTLFYWVSITVSFAWLCADHSVLHHLSLPANRCACHYYAAMWHFFPA